MPLSRRPNPSQKTRTIDRRRSRGADTTENEKEKTSWWVSHKRILLLVGALLGAATVAFLYSGDQIHLSDTNSIMSTKQESKNLELSVTDLKKLAKDRYENCTISYVPKPPRGEAEWRKPLWVPSFPGSGSASPSKRGDIVKELIDTITGLKQGTKNYHMSMRGGKLKRCRGISETAACSQGHPYVSVGPESQTNNFQSSVIFVIRNLATVLPAAHTEKHIAYHNGKGQAPERHWREVRDEYGASSMKSWRQMINWWRNADYYHIALYLPFEWMLSPTKGPDLVQKLADTYQAAGYDVAPPEDIPCIWYQVAKKEWVRQEQLMEYMPGYKAEQLDLLAQELTEQIQESQDDPILVELLEEYKRDIPKVTKLDVD